MENALPLFATKKKIQIQDRKKRPIIPVKPAEYLKQSRENAIQGNDNLISVSFDKIQKDSQDVTLLAFKRSDCEKSYDPALNPRNSSNSESDDTSMESYKSVLRKSLERKSSKHRRSSYYNNLDEISDGLNSLNTLTNNKSLKVPETNSPLKSLRETFDEYKSLMSNDELFESNNIKSNHDKFKRISEMPKFVQLKLDKKVETDKDHLLFKNNMTQVTSLVQCSRGSPGDRTTVICLSDPVRRGYWGESELQSPLSPLQDLRSPKTPLSEDPFGECISEDGLSDDGDIVLNDDEELEFSRPSSDVMLQSIPIVPTQQHQMTERKGFLFKYTSGQTSRLTSKLGTGWQKRWVTFDSKFLIYFSSPKSMVSRRVLPVCNMLNVKQIIKPSEQHPYQFRIIMKHKMAISFASDSSDDMSLWTSIIMKSILDASTKVEIKKSGGIFQLPDMQGFAKLEGTRGKKYLSCSQDKFVVYNTQSDFESQLPIFMLNMQLLSVRDINKLKLQINTPQSSHIFLFETQEEMNAWKQTLENGISCSLGDDEVMNKIYANQSNKFCADCGAEGPEWASINLGITLCQNCAGIHRKMVNAKIKSLRMDFRVWSENLVEMMKLIGNDNSNKVWERSMKPKDKITPSIDLSGRKKFIEDKYCKKVFFDAYQGNVDQVLGSSLKSVDVCQILRITFSGADVEKVLQEYEGNSSQAEISAPLVEFFRQNIVQLGS